MNLTNFNVIDVFFGRLSCQTLTFSFQTSSCADALTLGRPLPSPFQGTLAVVFRHDAPLSRLLQSRSPSRGLQQMQIKTESETKRLGRTFGQRIWSLSVHACTYLVSIIRRNHLPHDTVRGMKLGLPVRRPPLLAIISAFCRMRVGRSAYSSYLFGLRAEVGFRSRKAPSCFRLGGSNLGCLFTVCSSRAS